ncbi:hypothetical protein FRB99_001398 [Tulasnella sp. 403]|nr:hypothetical protein FRB99_001398 [Tulasnella sp. 403]
MTVQMGLSRTAKISILLTIDLGFFFVELVVGYAVGSLALVADSFHMLNDVMSLAVALYAIRLTKNNVASAEYSYGWHRAEILAALINGVFLLALCFSIAIEAIERFFSKPEVANPKLVVIVGTLGLCSNIIGLLLFHEHDHGHSHGEPATPPSGVKAIADASTIQTDLSPLLPSNSIAPPPHPISVPAVTSTPSTNSHRRSDSLTRGALNRRRSDSNNSISIHPAQVRASLVQVAEDLRAEGESNTAPPHSPTSPRRKSGQFRISTSIPPTDNGLDEVLARSANREADYRRVEEGRGQGLRNDVVAESDEDDEDAPLTSDIHKGHSHSHFSPAKKSNGGHSHSGSMNMRGVLLHVIGDALGNVGVIGTGLIIWLTSWSFKYYCDPIISLVITVIIFSSALPLVKSASFILLQGVPSSVSLEDVRSAILRIPGVISVHELHIWQLSESKIVASVHVLVRKSLKGCANAIAAAAAGKSGARTPVKGDGVQSLIVGPGEGEDRGEQVYMVVASEIRKVLHEFGIHSSTIQPEYAIDGMDDDSISNQSGCLIPCMADADCDPENACCPPAAPRACD